MNNFDLKKYLSENKLTANSKMLDEEQNIRKESLDEATNPLGLSKGDKITISSKVSNRPLGGYATFWEYTNGRVGYKVFGSSKVNYIDPQYVERRNYVADSRR